MYEGKTENPGEIVHPKVRVFDTLTDIAQAVAESLRETAIGTKEDRKPLNIALCGGNTPEAIYRRLGEEPIASDIPWESVHLFWGDERCVPPDDPQSNFGMTSRALLGQISIPEGNIHRIRGESRPENEAARYEKEIREFLPAGADGYPRFDWIFLGMGTDGHTASLFPNAISLEEKERLCIPVTHPLSGGDRITLTLPVLNSASRITFVVAGEEKSEMISLVFERKNRSGSYPCTMVVPEDGSLEWYLDRAAAGLLTA